MRMDGTVVKSNILLIYITFSVCEGAATAFYFTVQYCMMTIKQNFEL